ncbi:MAG: HAD family hydrolase [Chloroflexota bacterium]
MSLPANWRPRMIFFDLDDTLIHEAATDDGVIDEIADLIWPGRRLAPGALAEAVRTARRELWQQSGELAYCHRIGTGSSEGLYGDYSGDDPHLRALARFLQETNYRDRVWAIALGSLGIDDASQAARFARAYAETRRSRHIQLPDALPALQHLASVFRLGLITNGAPKIQRLKLAGSGLASYFEPVVISGDLGVGKPDPAIFRHALERAGILAESALMVGNSVTHDVAGAQSAGIRAVWINRTGESCPPEVHPDLVLRTLDGLTDGLA